MFLRRNILFDSIFFSGAATQGAHPSGQVSIVLNNQVPQALGNTPADVPPQGPQPRMPTQAPPLRPVPSYHSSTHFVARPRPVQSFSRMPVRPGPVQRYSNAGVPLIRAGSIPRLPPPPQGQPRPVRGPVVPPGPAFSGPRPYGI